MDQNREWNPSNFFIRIKIDVKPPLVIGRLSLTQAMNPPGNRITVGAGITYGFNKFLHHVGRRGRIWVAHTEVNHVTPGLAGNQFEAVNLRKNIRRQAGNTVKIGLHGGGRLEGRRAKGNRGERGVGVVLKTYRGYSDGIESGSLSATA